MVKYSEKEQKSSSPTIFDFSEKDKFVQFVVNIYWGQYIKEPKNDQESGYK